MHATTIQNTVMQKVQQKRDYLHQHEIDKLIAIAKTNTRKDGWYALRDSLLITVAYRHGLRVSELCDLTWEQIDFKTGRLHVERLKNGNESVQPMKGDEIRALRTWKKLSESAKYVFVSERKDPMTRDNVNKLLSRLGEAAQLEVKVHPHMLRHSCGYNLVNKGLDTRRIQDYLGHKNIQNTVKYTRLNESRFKGVENLF